MLPSTRMFLWRVGSIMNINAALLNLSAANKRLIFAGKSLEEISAIAGGTPCYAYNFEQVERQVAKLRTGLPRGMNIHYAIKANPMASLVGRIAHLVDGFDVASHKELMLALATGMTKDNISIAGPGKSDIDLISAISAQIVINVESENELQRIYRHCQRLGKKANIALRVNPDFQLKNSGVQMSGGAQPFGIDAEIIPQTISSLNTHCVNFIGLHIFCGSQNLCHKSLIQMHNQTFELATHILEEANVVAKQLNIGGGFGIPYFLHQTPLELDKVAQNLHTLMDKYESQLANTSVHLELGRYLVGESGIYVCRVVDKKVSRGKTFLVVDGGLHHHLANSGNFGQILRKNYPILVDTAYPHGLEKVDVVGPLCTPLDILAKDATLPVAQVNDFFVVLQSGAYGATASPIKFLSQPDLKEILF